MRIRWDEIPPDGLFFRIDETAWVPEQEIVAHGPGECEITLKKERAQVLLTGFLRLPVTLECDRCLDYFPYILAEDFEVIFKLLDNEKELGSVAEYFCQSNDLDVVYLEEPIVDLFSVLMQQVYLSLPEKRLCSDQCPGLCPECGGNLNRCPCSCTGSSGTSPFSVLVKLKIN